MLHKESDQEQQQAPATSDESTKRKAEAAAIAPKSDGSKHTKISEPETGNGIKPESANDIHKESDFVSKVKELNTYLEKKGYKPLWLQNNNYLFDGEKVELPFDDEKVRDLLPASNTSLRLFGDKDGKLYSLTYRLICEFAKGKQTLEQLESKLKPLEAACNAYIIIQRKVGDKIMLEILVMGGITGAHEELVGKKESEVNVKSTLIAAGEFFTTPDGSIMLVTNKTGHYFKIIDYTRAPAGKVEHQIFAPYYSKAHGEKPEGFFYSLKIDLPKDPDGMIGINEQLKKFGYKFVNEEDKWTLKPDTSEQKNKPSEVSVTTFNNFAKPPVQSDATSQVAPVLAESSQTNAPSK